MTEPVAEPTPPQSFHEPPDPERVLARKNVVFGLALFAVFLLIFGATIAVAYVYLAYD